MTSNGSLSLLAELLNLLVQYCALRLPLHLPIHQVSETLDRAQEKELHYTSIFSLTEEDAITLKDRISDLIKDNNKLIAESKEEEVFCFTMDLFSVKKSL